MKKRTIFYFFPGVLLTSLLLLTLARYAPVQAGGNDWYADPVIGNDTNSCTTPTTPCKTVLEAVNKAAAGDTVHLAAGTYNENSAWISKDLTIRGAAASTTIVAGNGSQALFLIIATGGVTPTVLIEDITLRNALNGAVINQGASTTLNRVVVEDNAVDFSNSVVSNSSNGRLNLWNSLVRNNNTPNGDQVIMNNGGAMVISNTAVINNTGANNTDALHNQSGSGMTLVNVTVSGNDGNGLVQPSGGNTVTATNVTIANNTGYGIFNYDTVNIKNSILAHNAQNCADTSSSTGVVLPVSLGNNIDSAGSCNFIQSGDQSSADPQLFPLTLYNGAWMRPFTANSPARNKGANAGCPPDDQSGAPRPKEGVCDVGAFEYDPANPPKMYVYLPLILRP